MDALKRQRVLVLVQGELAQSPRMLNHARELAAAGAEVHLMGFTGVPLPPEFAQSRAFVVHAISRLGAARWRRLPRPLFIPAAALRSLWLLLRIGWLLLYSLPRPHAILVQNPPALPAAALAAVAARVRRAILIVDWHNLTAAMLALRIGSDHPLVRMIERFERWLARRARVNLCVSEALRQRVQPSARRGTCLVLHDRPLRRPAPVSDAERVRILRRVSEAVGMKTGFAEHPAPVVMVSSTSWSADEDMAMLLDALSALVGSKAEQRSAILPPLAVIVTGLGPGRAEFEVRARHLVCPGLRIATGWLADDLYRDLLRAAQLGLSMHRSASGLDLPMKIVDMIEAGLPVLAYDYAPCLGELLPRERAAGLFTTPAELAEGLSTLLQDYPDLARLTRIRAAMPDLASPGWTEEWRRVAAPIFADRTSPSWPSP
ncbi:MAG TPA: glycosyltransferase [Stellaceae bacterium]|nr:glycosyltransferase [Stellaceae bacterium]